jgi:hypothetical protein
MVAKAIGRKAVGKGVGPVAPGDEYQHLGGRNGAEYLNYPVRQNFFCRVAAADREPEGHGGIQVTPGDMAYGEGHGDHGEPKCQGDAQEADSYLGEGGREYGAAAAAEHQPERTDEFGGQFPEECHVVSLKLAQAKNTRIAALS